MLAVSALALLVGCQSQEPFSYEKWKVQHDAEEAQLAAADRAYTDEAIKQGFGAKSCQASSWRGIRGKNCTPPEVEAKAISDFALCVRAAAPTYDDGVSDVRTLAIAIIMGPCNAANVHLYDSLRQGSGYGTDFPILRRDINEFAVGELLKLRVASKKP